MSRLSPLNARKNAVIVEPFELVGLTHADRYNVVVYDAELLAAPNLGNNARVLRAMPLPNQHPALESQEPIVFVLRCDNGLSAITQACGRRFHRRARNCGV